MPSNTHTRLNLRTQWLNKGMFPFMSQVHVYSPVSGQLGSIMRSEAPPSSPVALPPPSATATPPVTPTSGGGASEDPKDPKPAEAQDNPTPSTSLQATEAAAVDRFREPQYEFRTAAYKQFALLR